MKALKISTDVSLVPKGSDLLWLLHSVLEPQLAFDQSSRPYRRIHKNYYKISSDLFELVSMEEADVAVLPVDWSAYQGSYSWLSCSNRSGIARAQKFAEKARRLGKPVAVFFSGERSHETVPLPGAYVFRKSMYRSNCGDRDFVIPHVSYLDLLESIKNFQPARRHWNPKPTTGFCGMARSKTIADYPRQLCANLFHLIREGSCGVDQFKGLELRHNILQILLRSSQINTDFIMRGKSVFSGAEYGEERDLMRTQFLENLLISDYQVCVRGSANYSWRPWEALCVGRIPLFVDTDCVLPFSDKINWSKQMVVIDENDIDRLPVALMDFHSGMNDECFQGVQLACRSTWEQYFTPQGLARWLHGLWSEKLIT